MAHRLRVVGIVAVLVGVVFAVGGFYGITQVNAGYDSLEAFSEAQNVELSYNDDGELVDRGSTEGAEEIMDLLTDDWDYSVRKSEFDPDDPLVDTASEYMYQMATIATHVLHGTQTVELPEDVEYNGKTYEAGTYEFDVDGRYWTDFDRQDPIEGPARGLAWTGTAHGLIAELGVGAVTASALQLGMTMSWLMVALGVSILGLGLGLFWVGGAGFDPKGMTS
ncbi:MAG: hypothetical protein ACK2UL_03465 [Anaerolineae bacterium]